MMQPIRFIAPTIVTLMLVAPVWAQSGDRSPGAVNERLDTFGQDASGFFGQLFGGSDRASTASAPPPQSRPAPQTLAQASPSDLTVRLDRQENQIRQLTGLVEQLQFRNKELEQQMRRLQEDTEYRFNEQTSRIGGGRPTARQPAAQQTPPSAAPPAPPPGRRSDVFDPGDHPSASGAPRALGSLPAGSSGAGIPDEPEVIEAPIGAPGGRPRGAPLDLATLSEPTRDGMQGSLPPVSSAPLPAPAARTPNSTGAYLPTQAPSASAKDEYDLAYGYVLRKDYALAETGFRTFIKKHANDRMVADAYYWIGETLYQRQRYRDAAESFLTVSTKYEKAGKAPDSLLRLGQSLAALSEKEAACATFGEISRKYPRASGTVKQAVASEQKRVRC